MLSYHLDELLILSSDRVKDVLGVSISIIRFEYVLYVKARNFNLHKKMQISYIESVPYNNGEGFVTRPWHSLKSQRSQTWV